jgi:hypothetical protein
MADFNQATTVPTSSVLTLLASTLTTGSNNTGFGLSPKYVYGTEFSYTFPQATTAASNLALKQYPIGTYYGRPLDGRSVPYRSPDPWSLEVIGQPPLGAPVGVVVDDPNEFNIWYF